jgi:hypothetical protein
VCSIPNEVTGFFNSPNPSSRTVTLGSTQPLTEVSTRNLPADKGRKACKSDNLTTICEPIVWKIWEPRRLTTLCASMACYKDSLLFLTAFLTQVLIGINGMECNTSVIK